jgi:hypothetical protein
MTSSGRPLKNWFMAENDLCIEKKQNGFYKFDNQYDKISSLHNLTNILCIPPCEFSSQRSILKNFHNHAALLIYTATRL